MNKEFLFAFVILLRPLCVIAQIIQVPSSQQQAVSVMSDEYKVANNVWNANDPGKGSQTLSVDLNSTYFKVILSTHNSANVISYPFIWKGDHFGTRTSKNIQMPKMLTDIGTAPFTWSVSTAGVTGLWDAAFECWLDDVPSSTNYNGELMIWINYGGGAGPAGGRVATIDIGGHTWDVYFYLMPSWNYIAYKITTPTDSVSVDLKDFLHDALRRGYLKTSWYLANMEAGFEIWRDGQGLTTKSYSATVTSGNSLDENYPPAPFDIVYPPNNKYISSPVSLVIPFSWNQSNDPNSDPLSYIFHLYGPNIDTTMTDLDTTGILFDGSHCLQYYTQYNWEVKATDGIDTVTSKTNMFKTPRSTGVQATDRIPDQFFLDQNYPNPFNPSTNIRLQTNTSGFVVLKVYDVLGRVIATLLNEDKPPGMYTVQWNADAFDAGVYFCRLSVSPSAQHGRNSNHGIEEQANLYVATRKMVLIK